MFIIKPVLVSVHAQNDLAWLAGIDDGGVTWFWNVAVDPRCKIVKVRFENVFARVKASWQRTPIVAGVARWNGTDLWSHLARASINSSAQSQGAPAGSTNSPPSVQEGEDCPFGNTSNAPPAVDPNVTGSTTMTWGGSVESNCSAYDKARTSWPRRRPDRHGRNMR